MGLKMIPDVGRLSPPNNHSQYSIMHSLYYFNISNIRSFFSKVFQSTSLCTRFYEFSKSVIIICTFLLLLQYVSFIALSKQIASVVDLLGILSLRNTSLQSQPMFNHWPTSLIPLYFYTNLMYHLYFYI